MSGKANVVDGNRRVRARDRGGRAVPAPEANAELQANLDVCLADLPVFYFFALNALRLHLLIPIFETLLGCALVFLLWPSGCAMPLSGCSPGSVFGLGGCV